MVPDMQIYLINLPTTLKSFMHSELFNVAEHVRSEKIESLQITSFFS